MVVAEKWSIGEIKRLLKQAKVSFEAASKVLGLSKNGLEKLDNNSVLPLDMLHTLGEHYGLQITGLKKSGSTIKEADIEPAERLRQAREELGLSQSEFGQLIGLTQAAVSKFEMRLIPLRKLVLLAIEHVYSIRGEWLLYGEGPKYLSKKTLRHDDVETLEIAAKLKPDDRQVWRQIGKCFLNARWDGKIERRKKARPNKGK